MIMESIHLREAMSLVGNSVCVLTMLALLMSPMVHAIEYSHGVSYIEPLKYEKDFTHFDYVNPDAPKVGTVRVPEMGTFDSFNGILDKGRVASGYYRLGAGVLVYDRLLEKSADEPASYYGRLASGVWVAEDFREFAFKIRDGAFWHDGRPLTAEDVVFTFETLREKGAVGVRTALLELGSIERISDNEVLFKTRPGALKNPDLIFAVGGYSILPKHYWTNRDITKTTSKPPLGSGPYRATEFELGRKIMLERIDKYWGDDLPVNKGRYNFSRVKFDFFRDESVQLEAIKADVIDIRVETISKNWTIAYDFPAVRAGYFKKNLVDIARPWGLWAPIMWNMEREDLQDIRVREALWLLSDFRWTNRVLMFGFYNYAKSYFYNSRMAASGMPSERELALLEPLRAQVPERVFTEPFVGNESTGYGYSRERLKRSIKLFKEAGWEIRDGTMANVATGEPFRLSFIFGSPFAQRQEIPLMRAINRLGIETTSRVPEVSNWLYRLRNGKFDATTISFEPGNVPGLMLRNRLTTASANSEGGQNYGGIRNPAVDTLVAHVMAARTPEDLYAATKALDRVLLWNFYYINGLGAPGYRLVYWDKFGIPESPTRLQRAPWLDTWWWDEAKVERVRAGMAELTGR
tara:strand:+ start:6347 stop:8251 length:1905 start_codon:yes stop_codon:yes gene_type:complete